MQHEKTIWHNLPSTDTPINANNLNNIEDTLYDLTREDDLTIQPNAPWLGDIHLKRRGNRVSITAELTGADPYAPASAIVFTVPTGYAPKTFVIVDSFTQDGQIPLQYAFIESEDVTIDAFYLNTKLALTPETTTANDLIISTFYFLD